LWSAWSGFFIQVAEIVLLLVFGILPRGRGRSDRQPDAAPRPLPRQSILLIYGVIFLAIAVD
jgi:hypothetical protein